MVYKHLLVLGIELGIELQTLTLLSWEWRSDRSLGNNELTYIHEPKAHRVIIPNFMRSTSCMYRNYAFPKMARCFHHRRRRLSQQMFITNLLTHHSKRFPWASLPTVKGILDIILHMEFRRPPPTLIWCTHVWIFPWRTDFLSYLNNIR